MKHGTGLRDDLGDITRSDQDIPASSFQTFHKFNSVASQRIANAKHAAHPFIHREKDWREAIPNRLIRLFHDVCICQRLG